MEAEPDDEPFHDPESVPGVVTRCHPELDGEPDDGLVTYMAFKSTDEELALRACEELHRRHSRFLLAWCIKHRQETFGDAAEDFVNQTFLRSFREAEGFVCTDRTKGTEQVLAWLFRILKNLYLDSLRAEKRRPALRNADGNAEWLVEIAENRVHVLDQVPTGRKALALEYWQSLPARDRELLTVTAEFWDPAKGEPDIDADVRKGICREYGLTECSLRVRRKRLKDRGKAYIQERETIKETKKARNAAYEDPAESRKSQGALGR